MNSPKSTQQRQQNEDKAQQNGKSQSTLSNIQAQQQSNDIADKNKLEKVELTFQNNDKEAENQNKINSQSQINEKTNNNLSQKSIDEDGKEKIVLTAKELSVMNKQLKKLDKLKKQNEQLKKHITNLEQTYNQQLKKQTNTLANKSVTKIQGLQETIKQLQKLLHESNSNEQLFQRQSTRSKQLYRNQKQMNSNLKIEIDELRNMSSEHFLLKQQISRLNNQCKKLKQANEAYPHLKKDYEALQSRLQNANQNLIKKEAQSNSQAGLRLKLQKKLQALLEEKRGWEKEKVKLICQKEQVGGECDAIKQQLQDQRAEKQLTTKKNVNEIKQLKIALHQEHQKLKLTQIQVQQLQKELQHNKKRPKVDLEQKIRYAELNKEDLFNLLQEAEMKIVVLKMAVNDEGEQLSKYQKSIKQKEEAIFALTRQLTKAYPNLDESQGMQYVEKDIIEMGLAQKEDWGEIVEKVMLQNLRLKYSVTALGEQYNNQMRKNQQK